MLKHVKVSKKLWLIVFPAILAMAALVVFFYYRTNSIAKDSKKALYDETFVSTALILNADRDFYQAIEAEKELYLSAATLSPETKKKLIDTYNENVNQVKDRITQAMDNLKANKQLYEEFKSESKVTLSQLYKEFQAEFASWQGAYNVETGTGNMSSRQAYFDNAREKINLMTELLEEYADKEATEIQKGVESSIMLSITVIAAVMVVLFILSLLIVSYIKDSIKYITGVNQRIAQGELAIKIEEKRMTRDEIGQLCKATDQILVRLNEYVSYINEITQVLNKMADGDMRIALQRDYRGEFSSIKEALLHISSSLNQTLSMIASSAGQVDMGAKQIASGAQALAQGTTEQASAIEELSASITDVSQEVQGNAANVKEAAEYVGQTVASVEESNAYMKQMLVSMKEIDRSSLEISKIIKVIDDIAFQTNILALNAAVEAARAGAAGKGFAVVADEVRNLATKSADAAKQTTELIENSIKAVSAGSKMAENTAKALENVSSKAVRIKEIIGKIDSASSAQASAISQITISLGQVSNVVQTNTATAEESAAASEELSGQSAMLFAEVGKFKLSGKTDNIVL